MGEKLLFLVGGNRGKNPNLGLKKKGAEEKQECEEHLAFVKDSLLESRPEKHGSKVERGWLSRQ